MTSTFYSTCVMLVDGFLQEGVVSVVVVVCFHVNFWEQLPFGHWGDWRSHSQDSHLCLIFVEYGVVEHDPNFSAVELLPDF